MYKQLTLFETKEDLYKVSYWSYPYDKKGNLMPWICQNWIEIVNKKKLDFWQECIFKDCRYFNIKIEKI